MSNMIKKVIPMLDRILIQRFEVKTTTAGGILLPEEYLPQPGPLEQPATDYGFRFSDLDPRR